MMVESKDKQVEADSTNTSSSSSSSNGVETTATVEAETVVPAATLPCHHQHLLLQQQQQIPHPYLESIHESHRRHFHDVVFSEGIVIGQILERSGRGRLNGRNAIQRGKDDYESASQQRTFGRVIELDVGYYQYKVPWTMPDDVAICDQLQKMTLMNCGELPRTMKYLNTTLRRLKLIYHLHGNSHKRKHEDKFYNLARRIAVLTNLQTLEVSFYLAPIKTTAWEQKRKKMVSSFVNHLCGGGRQHLQDVVASWDDSRQTNSFVDRPSKPKTVTAWTSLTSLTLGGISLEAEHFYRLIFEMMTQFPNLEKLDLRRNRIGTIQLPGQFLCKLRDTTRRRSSLRSLNLADNPMTVDTLRASSTLVEEKRAVVTLLQTFPVLDEIFLPMIGVSCSDLLSTGDLDDRRIFHWLTINRAGRILLEPATGIVDEADRINEDGEYDDEAKDVEDNKETPISLWPTVLSRCNRITFNRAYERNFERDLNSVSPGQVNGIYHLLRHVEGGALTNILILHGNKKKEGRSSSLENGIDKNDHSTVASGSIVNAHGGRVGVDVDEPSSQQQQQQQPDRRRRSIRLFLSKMKINRKKRAYV